jgi:hypothetical protein
MIIFVGSGLYNTVLHTRKTSTRGIIRWLNIILIRDEDIETTSQTVVVISSSGIPLVRLPFGLFRETKIDVAALTWRNSSVSSR